MKRSDYFRHSGQQTRLKFFLGICLVILMILAVALQLLGLISWGGLVLIGLVLPGVGLTSWGLLVYPAVRRSNAVREAEFPAEFQLPDLLRAHDLQIPSIGAFLLADHLFILHRSWYYLINLKTVRGLYVASGSSRIQDWDELVVDTIDGHRLHWMLPRPDGRATDGELEAGLQILFTHLRATFSHIQLGRTRDRDPRTGDPEGLKGIGDPDRWVSFNQSWQTDET